ncbi:unnamed protein product [Allacma fusca]|uniref:Methionine--tRNA ligase, cytoplasmic n=1 Tax=Allacma fusca TaxID=39272 RepID=A0A8J2L0G4_9HEXA|nr:unnamed protein product [Allacma fusca]
MQLITDPNNSAGLKVLITALKTKQNVQVEFTEQSSTKLRLPVLRVNGLAEVTELFDMNAAVLYLMESVNIPVSESLEEYRQFEAFKLRPALTAYASEKGSSDEGIKRTLNENLSVLEKLLMSQKFIAGKSAGFEDIILWASIHPLIVSHDKILEGCPKINEWYKRLQGIEYFTKAVAKLQPPLAGKIESSPANAKKPNSKVPVGKKGPEPIVKSDENEEKEDTKVVLAEELNAAKINWSVSVDILGPQPKKPDTILPIPGQKNIMISSALPYVNNVPHLGTIIGCVLSADVFSRYCRMRGRNTLYICGTDEYGTATETKALQENMTEQEICDKYHKIHSEVYRWFNIDFDFFGRTTTNHQTEIGQDIFLNLMSNGYLKEMPVQQCFCVPCQKFLSDRFVEGVCPMCGYEDARGDQCDKCGRLTNSVELKNPRCKICSSSEVITKSSEQVFLDLPKLEDKEDLGTWVEKRSEVWSPNARQIVRSWLREGLKERCITRDLKWGTPVPIEKYKNKVFYVWFDAPIGYISITANYTSSWKEWWQNPDVDIDYYEFMAKDNVPFHGILFPASCIGTKQPWTLVKYIMATEYLNYEDTKFSKSRGYGVFGNDAKDTGIPADIWRFYLLYVRPEAQDSAFSWDDFMTKNNSELLNNLGNFINRSLSFLEKFFDSTVPAMDLLEEDYNIAARVNQEISAYVVLQDVCKMKDALRQILSISKIGNQYFQAQKPWTLTKKSEDLPRCSTICGLGVQIVFVIATLLEPYMPETAATILQQLNVPKTYFSMHLQQFIPSGHKIGKVKPLFQKMEAAVIDSLKQRYGGPQQKA